MRSYVDRVLSAFEVNLVAIIVAVGTSYILFAPAQFREIYRSFAQSAASLATVPGENLLIAPEFWSTVPTSIYTFIGLALLSILIWLACRSNRSRTGDPVSDAGDSIDHAVAMTRRAIGLGLAVLPFLALSLGLYTASSSRSAVAEVKDLLVSTKELQLQSSGTDPALAHEAAVGWATQVVSYNDILIGLAVVLALSGVLLVIMLNAFEGSERTDSVGRFILSGPAALAASIMFLGLCVAFSVESGATTATHVSAVPILCAFAALSLVVVNYLMVRSGAIGRLFAWAFAAAAIVFSIFDLNNNHRVRRIALPDTVQVSPTTPSLSDIFLTWYNARVDRPKFTGRYPIYVVAAQGGGIYAAYHAATFLSTVQQRCPNFAHHLFAISSVSGGSAGSAVFAALMKDAELRKAVNIPARGCSDPQEPSAQTLVDDAKDVLDADFWSPLQARALFPDLLQRFMPIGIEKFDRAIALEQALEASWQKAKASSIMAEPFPSLWPAGFERSQFTPALVLNTTEVDTGRRRLIAPFTFAGLTDIRFFPVNCVSAGTGPNAKRSIESIPLSTAAVLSARFPWVTPTGWYYGLREETREMRDCTPPPNERVMTKLSDGGYFEDSGVASALDLISSLQEVVAKHKLPVDIKLIILTSGGFTSEAQGGLDEAMDPIRTMLNARSARAFIEVGRAERVAGLTETEAPTPASDRVLKVIVDGLGYPLPLGWSLSDLTRLVILFQAGDTGPCERQRGLSTETTAKVRSSSCVIEGIVRQLTYEAAPTQ